jgi:geranylgeranyl diphosphate synthase type I
VTGKPVGDDLREGKPTPLLARACERATPAEMESLDRVGRVELDDDTVRVVQEIIVSTGALQDMEDTIERLTTEALAALDAIPFDAGVKVQLTELAGYVSDRPS